MKEDDPAVLRAIFIFTGVSPFGKKQQLYTVGGTFEGVKKKFRKSVTRGLRHGVRGERQRKKKCDAVTKLEKRA